MESTSVNFDLNNFLWFAGFKPYVTRHHMNTNEDDLESSTMVYPRWNKGTEP